MKIIVGLGNLGQEYKKTRHNAGFMAVDAIAKQNGLNWVIGNKFKAEIARGNNMLLIKPMTLMNNSGLAVQAVMAYYKLLPKLLGIFSTKDADISDVLTTIHDDIDIALGKYKTSINSGSAGHRGVESIINILKTKNFERLRIGINNNKPMQMPTEKYVLQNFNPGEIETINKVIADILNELPCKIY